MKLNISNSIKKHIWNLDSDKLPPFKAELSGSPAQTKLMPFGYKEKAIKSLKVLVLSAQGFSRDMCSLRASALTLYTLLSIVPVIAMLFGIAKGFGLEKMLKQQLLEQVPNQETMVLQLIGFAQNLLDNTQGEVVAGTGIIILFWTIISVISDIEKSFNYIWKVPQGRPLSRKFSDYLSLMLLAPVVLITSGSITVFLKTQLTWLVNMLNLPEIGEWFVIRALSLLPLVLMTGLFAFMFIFVPNRKIDYKAGIIAGFVTAVMYTLAQWAYLSLQLGVSTYNAIYGSFAALPLFVVWLQVGWMITLFGCQIAFFLHNYENYQHGGEVSNLSFSMTKIIALQVTHLIIKNFIPVKAELSSSSAQTELIPFGYNKPLTASQITRILNIPLAVTQSVLYKLAASHIIIEFKNQDEYEVYQPAVDVNKLSIAYVVNALEQCGQNQLPGVNQDPLFTDIVNDFRKLAEASQQDRLLKDI